MKNGHGIDSISFAGGTLPVKGFSIFANRWTVSSAQMRKLGHPYSLLIDGNFHKSAIGEQWVSRISRDPEPRISIRGSDWQ
jgi:hypothetical protein